MEFAESFDVFGLIAFILLLTIGLKIRKKEKLGWVIIFISCFGIIIDGYIVIKTYFLGG